MIVAVVAMQLMTEEEIMSLVLAIVTLVRVLMVREQ